jgi:sugar lactone lactonase YvrE
VCPELTLLAGKPGGNGSLDGIGADARFWSPTGVVYDGTRYLYVVDSNNHVIRRVELSTGQVTTIVGSSGVPDNTDGFGGAARFNSPQQGTYDNSRYLYIADAGNSTIRKIDVATGQVATLAGSPGVPGSTDGVGASARFNRLEGLLYDGSQYLYVADTGNHTIRRIVVGTGQVTTLAGAPGIAGSADGSGAGARFNSPRGMAYDGSRYLYVADRANHVIRQIDVSTGTVSTLAGTAASRGTSDGVGTSARFSNPTDLAYGSAGYLWVTDYGNHTIRRVDLSTRQVTTLAGGASSAGSGDGIGTSARFANPRGLVYDGTQALFVADSGNSTIRRVDLATMAVTTLAGTAVSAGSADGTGANARFKSPSGLASDGARTLFVADVGNNTIRQLEIDTGRVTTLAGRAGTSGRLDGTGANALFAGSFGLAYDGSRYLYVSDATSNSIRRIDVSTGQVTTLAGGSGGAGSRDGQGSSAQFNFPLGLAYDGSRYLFVADGSNSTIRRVDVATGDVTTLAGTPGVIGNADGMGPSAQFYTPQALAHDGVRFLFVTDQNNPIIRRIDVGAREVTTLAGSRGAFGSVDGLGASARFGTLVSLAYDGSRYLFAGEYDLIRRVEIATGEVTTVIGQSGQRGLRTGPLSQARLNAPQGLTVLPGLGLAISSYFENSILIATGL